MVTTKKLFLIPLVIVLVLAALSLASAGFPDFWARITGKATSGTTALNISIGNSAPSVSWIESISAQNPTDDTFTTVTFNLTVTDTDGYANVNFSSINASFMRAGETTRTNTSCVSWANASNNANFTCKVSMWYYDQNGAWTINVSAKDVNSAYNENSSTTFTYNLLPGMKMSPTSLSWGSVGLSDTNTGSNNDPVVINNTGNDEPVNINVTAYNLRGEITITEYIYANNFTVENATEGCSGTAMVNETSTNVTSSVLFSGNHTLNYNNATSGQEQIYFCLKGVPQSISSQSYSSAAHGPWMVEIIS